MYYESSVFVNDGIPTDVLWRTSIKLAQNKKLYGMFRFFSETWSNYGHLVQVLGKLHPLIWLWWECQPIWFSVNWASWSDQPCPSADRSARDKSRIILLSIRWKLVDPPRWIQTPDECKIKAESLITCLLVRREDRQHSVLQSSWYFSRANYSLVAWSYIFE